VPDLVLNQALPEASTAQRRWLPWLCEVVAHSQHKHPRGLEALTWCLGHLDRPERQEHAIELIDWMRAAGEAFQPTMGYAAVKTATDAWHEAQHAAVVLGHRRLRSRAMDMRVADYTPLPKTWTGPDGLSAHALLTSADLEEESQRMHHCVRSYWERVIDGDTRIYSFRIGSKRIATLELRPEVGAHTEVAYRRAQLRGPCNATVTPQISAAADAFIAKANELIAAHAEAPKAA
jgi:hypothetical protein